MNGRSESQQSTPGQDLIRSLVTLLSTHGSPPSAVAAAGWAAAMAAAVTESTTPHPSTNRRIEDVMDAVDDDTAAYWSDQDQDNTWITQTPLNVAKAAEQIALATADAFTANPADMRASWALAVGAAAAAEVIAESNANERPGRAVIAGGTIGQVDLIDVADAHGCRVRTVHGRTLLDISSGLYNTPLGHRHPAPTIGMIAQASKVASVNPFVATSAIADRLANRILDLFDRPEWRVVFAGSGSEGIETALRIALTASGPIVYARPGTFHGITAGAASLSSHPAVRGPFPPSDIVRHQPISEWRTPGVGVVEPAGITWGHPTLTSEEIGQLRRFRKAGGVVIVDEVLSGLGRTLWPGLTKALNIPADIVVLGKGLANGIAPVSAVLVHPNLIDRIQDAGDLDHGHTHTNHPASLGAAFGCLAALGELTHDPCTLGTSLDEAGIAAQCLGWLATLDFPPTDRTRVSRALVDVGLLGHLPSMVDPIERLVIAPPLSTSKDDLAEMAHRLSAFLIQVRP